MREPVETKIRGEHGRHGERATHINPYIMPFLGRSGDVNFSLGSSKNDGLMPQSRRLVAPIFDNFDARYEDCKDRRSAS